MKNIYSGHAMYTPLLSSAPSLQLGSEGEEVKRLQAFLHETGYYKNRIDGYYGEETREAVTLLQRGIGVRASGAIDAKTEQAIERIRQFLEH